jgi:hypothetical protein
MSFMVMLSKMNPIGICKRLMVMRKRAFGMRSTGRWRLVELSLAALAGRAIAARIADDDHGGKRVVVRWAPQDHDDEWEDAWWEQRNTPRW